MRTRRSPRNQEKLWRELGQQAAPSPEPKRSETEILTALLARTDLKPRDRRHFEAQLAREKAKALLRECRKADR